MHMRPTDDLALVPHSARAVKQRSGEFPQGGCGRSPARLTWGGRLTSLQSCRVSGEQPAGVPQIGTPGRWSLRYESPFQEIGRYGHR